MSEVDYFTHFEQEAEAELEQIEKEQEQERASLRLSKDDFRKSFFGMHSAAAAFTGRKALALPNSHVNEDIGNEVSDAIFETIEDIPMLHFMLEPNNKWIGRAFVMVVYVQGMRNALAAEKGAINKQANKQKQTQARDQKSHDTGELTPEQMAALTGA